MFGFKPPLGGETAQLERRLLPFAKKAAEGSFYKGLKFGYDGMLLSVPFIAMDVATAPRGEKLASFGSASLSAFVTFPLLTAGLTVALSFTGPAAPFIAAVLALYPDSKLNEGLNRSIRQFTAWGRDVRRLEMGGQYQDTQYAQAQRMQAISAMSATMQNSRRFLGQEALLFHR